MRPKPRIPQKAREYWPFSFLSFRGFPIPRWRVLVASPLACLAVWLIYLVMNLLVFGVLDYRLGTVRMSTGGQDYIPIALPYTNSSKKVEKASFRVGLFYLPWHGNSLLINLGGGCITSFAINGRPQLDLLRDPNYPCECQNVPDLNLSQHVSSGWNTLDIGIESKTGNYHFALIQDNSLRGLFDVLGKVLPQYLLEAAVFCGLLLWLRINLWMTGIIVTSLFINILVFNYSTIFEYSPVPDIWWHLRYVEYLVNHNFMPPEASGRHYQQPPLYYELCAAIYVLAKRVALDSLWAIRLFSHFMYLGYLLFAVLFIELFSLPRLAKITALALVLFIPDANLIAVRLNNDIGFMFFSMWTFYLLELWWSREPKMEYLGKAAVLAGLSFLCKGTGALTMAVVGLVCLSSLILRHTSLRDYCNRALYGYAGLAGVFTAIYFGRIAYYKWIVGIPNLWFENGYGNFPGDAFQLCYFDVVEFLMKPTNWGGTYWNYFFHTLLYGDQFVLGSMGLMSTINALWIFLFGLCFIQCVRQLLNQRGRLQPYLVPLIIWWTYVFGQMAERVIVLDHKISAARYIQQITVIFGVYLASFMLEQRQQGNTILYYLISGVVALFSVLSTVLVIIRVLGL